MPELTRRSLLGTGAVGLAAAATTGTTAARAASAATRPTNIVLILADDLSAATPSVGDGRPGLTPHIDALAQQGTVFDRAHVPVAVCQPSRSALLTGRYPRRNGDEGYVPIRADVPVLVDVLHARNYRCGVLNKVDEVDPVERFGWDLTVPFGDLAAGRNPGRYAGRYAAAASRFFAQARREARRFFLMVNIADPHRPFDGSADERAQFNQATLSTTSTPSQVYDPASVTVPGFLTDLPEVRTELAQYESSTRRADDTVGAVLAQLDAQGLTSTTMVVRWPGVALAGQRTSTAFVSTLDLYPTMVRAAGGPTPAGIDGVDLARTELFLRRVPEELYDLSVDPHRMVNLAPTSGRPVSAEARQALTQLRRSTARWMAAKADPLRPAYVAAFPSAA